MSDFVRDISEIIENIEELRSYGAKEDSPEKHYHDELIKRGKKFVAVKDNNGFRFAPSRFAGYARNDMRHRIEGENRSGGDTDEALLRILGSPLEPHDAGYDNIESKFQEYCNKFSITPFKNTRRYWLIDDVYSDTIPDEVRPGSYPEGAVEKILVNKFERSKEARDECIKQHGFSCSACGINLSDCYGEIAEGFIHVHHIRPLSSIGKRYIVNPIDDLRPVCPNCHAIIHRTKEMLSIDAVKALIKKHRKA